MAETHTSTTPTKYLTILVTLGFFGILALTVDRYVHNQHRSESLRELAMLGLNHEFSDGGSSNRISFYSTGDLIAQAPRELVLRNLRTLSAKYNGGFRYGYTIDGFIFFNGTPDDQLVKDQLVKDLREAFPQSNIQLQKPNRE